MYKLLLSGRYLRTRFIALASIVSVMLGVATMIVVNSVMAGFSGEMKDRLHGILADMMVESISSDGFDNPVEVMQWIDEAAGEHIEAITPVIEVYGMMSFDWPGGTVTQPVTLVGIDPQGKDMVSSIRQYMMTRQEIREDGRLVRAAQQSMDAPFDWELTADAMNHRREWLQWERIRARTEQHEGAAMYQNPSVEAESIGDGDPFAEDGNPFDDDLFPSDDAESSDQVADVSDPDEPLSARVFIGVGLISYPYVESETGKTRTMMMLEPGEDVRFTTVTTGTPDAARFAATVADVFKSGMSEYDSTLVFCNLEELQLARKMLSPLDEKDWRNGAVTSLQIKLKDYNDAPLVAQKLLASLPAGEFQVRTWEQKQGPLLQAVEVEAAILNVLLFLIIAVAGFGILAIFYMIVVEKTRDIGILKALGASSGGVMSIFLTYGLGLGVVGSGVGVGLGLLFVKYINEIEDAVSWVTGRKVFDETIYYFHEIPTAVHPAMVVWVAIGAMAIAVLASVLPARRASQLDPVQALRYE